MRKADTHKRGAIACAACVVSGIIAIALGATELEVFGVAALAFGLVAYLPDLRKP